MMKNQKEEQKGPPTTRNLTAKNHDKLPAAAADRRALGQLRLIVAGALNFHALFFIHHVGLNHLEWAKTTE